MALTYSRTADGNLGAGQVEVDPISRIEGHLGVKLTIASGTVTSAEAHGNLWRGFENFLIGREVNDAITFTQRICGVCPVPHGQSATFAADAVLGYNDNFQTFKAGGQYSPSGLSNEAVKAVPASDDRTAVGSGKGIPAKAIHIRNLVLSAEFLMSHITHSYHLAAPSYIQGPNIPPWTPYYADSFYHEKLQATGKGIGTSATSNANQSGQPGATLPNNVAGFSKDLWSAVIKQYVKALRIRRLTFEAGALFAGRMPMTSCFVAGGVTTDKNESLTTKCSTFRDMMEEVGDFIVTEFVPLFLALGALYPEWDNVNNDALAGSAGLGDCLGYGGGVGNYLSWGAFPQTDGLLGLRRGYKVGSGSVQPILASAVSGSLREHIKYSRYQGSVTTVAADGTPVIQAAVTETYPGTEARTVPERGMSGKYSWLKAPRWNGQPMEVGPMARMFVAGFYQDNVALATSMASAGLSGGLRGYDYYVKEVTGTSGTLTGLDPAMVAPDIAVALVRESLATLTIRPASGADTVVNAAFLAGLTDDEAGYNAIVGAYTNPRAVITGTVASWIYGLKAGKSTMDRLRARSLESLILIQKMIGPFTKGTGWTGGGWLGDLAAATGDTYIQHSAPTVETSGFGATEAPRGALMHMCTVDGTGRIKRYQCIVPTTWNASPKCSNDLHGPMEQAMIGTKYSTATTAATGGGDAAITAGGGVEALRVAQSFDPCIACAVH